MASSQSYSDFERDCESHLSNVRSLLARPSGPNRAADVARCESFLRDAKQCAHAMLGLAEIEGDPFKAEGARRRLERDVAPLEAEVRGRRDARGGDGGSVGSGISSISSISSALRRGVNGGRGGGRGGNESHLFGSRGSYAPPSIGGADGGDPESEEGFPASPLSVLEQSMRDSEQLLLETQRLCAESEQIGAATIETMGRQREQIERSSGLIERAMEDTRHAREVMREMALRAFKNKIFLYCVIALLLWANGLAIAHLWRKKK